MWHFDVYDLLLSLIIFDFTMFPPVAFPSGTPVSLSLALASWDGNIFPDPFTFNHTRDNLMSHMINFTYPGHDANSMPRRSCPGKNIALKAGVDVLTAWLEKKEQMKFG